MERSLRESKKKPIEVNLPQEILEDILLKIPAEFLVTLKVVCKLWFDLITDPKFVEVHLNHHRGDFYQILVNKPIDFCDKEYELIKVKELKHTNEFQLHIRQLQEFLYGDTLRLHFSFDGLLLFESKKIYRQLYVCNPVTRKCTTLPILKTSLQTYITNWTLVYDSSVQKYNVVGFSFSSRKCFLFTSRSRDNSNEGNAGNTSAAAAATNNGWRELIMPNRYFSIESIPTVLSEEIHFLATKHHESFVCSMDVAKGDIRERRVPFIVDNCLNVEDAIVEVMGSLCVTRYSHECGQFDIWTLQDKNEGLWTKTYSIDLQFEPSLGVTLCSYPSSTYSCQTKILVSHQNQIFVYDLKKKDCKRIDFLVCKGMDIGYNFVHVNSFVKWE